MRKRKSLRRGRQRPIEPYRWMVIVAGLLVALPVAGAMFIYLLQGVEFLLKHPWTNR